MTRKLLWLMVVGLAMVFLAACGAQQASTPEAPQEQAQPAAEEGAAPAQEGAGEGTGDPARGKELFNAPALAGQAGCASCHSLEPDVTLVGPSMAGIATRAAQRVSGMSAEEYLKQSLLEPDAYVVEGFPQGVMPAYTGLSEQELQDLIAFMLTLK